MFTVILVLAAVTALVIRYGADTTEAAEWRWAAPQDPGAGERHVHTPVGDLTRLAVTARQLVSRLR